MRLVRSKKRVVAHGEVFTPLWMVEAILGLVEQETERIVQVIPVQIPLVQSAWFRAT